MFGVLLESRATAARRGKGAIVSIVSHVALVVGAVVATATESNGTITPVVPTDTVRWVAPIDDHGTATGAGPRRAQRTPAPDFMRPLRPVRLDFSGATTDAPIDVDFTRGGKPGEGIDWCVRRADCDVASGPSGRLSGDSSAFASPSALMARLLGEPPRPRYPEGLRAAGLGGRVLVQFTVDTAGLVEPRSVRVLEATHEQFANAVRDVLPRYRFVPAELNGRRTRMSALMPFEFTITR